MGETQSASDNQTETPRRALFKKFLWMLLGLVITVVVIAVAFGQYSVHRAFPQTEGTIQTEALSESDSKLGETAYA